MNVREVQSVSDFDALMYIRTGFCGQSGGDSSVDAAPEGVRGIPAEDRNPPDPFRLLSGPSLIITDHQMTVSLVLHTLVD